MSRSLPPVSKALYPAVIRATPRLSPSAVAAFGCSLLTGAFMGASAARAQDATAAPPQAPSPAPSVAEAISQEVRAVFDRCRTAVVRIEASDAHGELSGTGFFIDPNGTLFTSYTVGGETRDITVCDGQRRLPARRLVGDPRSGVAILKVDAQTPFLAAGKSRALPIASPVLTIGYPMDLPVSPSFGTLAGFDIQYGGRYFAAAHLRANVPVQRGQGGSPLLNLQGEVIGILISSLDMGSAAFVLPIEAAEKVRKDFVRFGEVRPGWLGIGVLPAAAPVAGSTAQVDELFEDAPARKAGLQKDDIILQIGELPIHSPNDVRNASFFTTAEDQVTVTVSRGGVAMQIQMTAADHPNSAHTASHAMPQLQAIPLSAPGPMPVPVPNGDRLDKVER